jgi:hypothetical protein
MVHIVQNAGRERKTSPQPGFDPRTVQPIASRNTPLLYPAPYGGYGTMFKTTVIVSWIQVAQAKEQRSVN